MAELLPADRLAVNCEEQARPAPLGGRPDAPDSHLPDSSPGKRTRNTELPSRAIWAYCAARATLRAGIQVVTPSRETFSNEQSTPAVESHLNALFRLRRSAAPHALASRLFGTPDDKNPDIDAEGGDHAA